MRKEMKDRAMNRLTVYVVRHRKQDNPDDPQWYFKKIEDIDVFAGKGIILLL